MHTNIEDRDTSLWNVLAGTAKQEEQYHQVVRLETICDFLPKDPKVNLRVYTGELAPDGRNSYHFHNGFSVFIVIEGRIDIHFKDGVQSYKAGDAYTQPIGVVHHAHNPDKSRPCTFIGVIATPEGRDHMVNVGKPDDFDQRR